MSSRTGTAPVVSIVSVAHNAREGLLKGLAAVQAGTEVPTEMIVVDNGSTDNTAAAVRYAFREVTLVRRDERAHHLAALNEGAGLGHAPWLLLLDPGLEPVGDTIRTLVEFAGGHPEYRLYTGRTLGAGREDDGRTVEGPPTLWGTACLAAGLPLDPERLPGLDRAIGGEVPAITPRMLLVERRLWDELGGFDERLPAADLSVRARARGARPVLVPDARMRSLPSTAKDGAGKNGTAKDDAGKNGTAKDGAGKNGTAKNRTGKDGAAEVGAAKTGAGKIGAARTGAASTEAAGTVATAADAIVVGLGERMAFAHRHWTPGRARAAVALLSAGVLARSTVDDAWREAWRRRSQWQPAPAARAAVPAGPDEERASAGPDRQPAAAGPDRQPAAVVPLQARRSREAAERKPAQPKRGAPRDR